MPGILRIPPHQITPPSFLCSSVFSVTITAHLFETYLNCPTKCFLRSIGETGTGNSYAEWKSAQNNLYQRLGSIELRNRFANDECVTGPLDRTSLNSATWLLATESTMRARELETIVD